MKQISAYVYEIIKLLHNTVCLDNNELNFVSSNKHVESIRNWRH